MSIKFRLTLIIAVLLGVLVLQAAVTLFYRGINDDLTERLSTGVRNTAEIGFISTELQKLRRFEKEYFIYVGSPEKRRGYDADVRRAISTIAENLTRMGLNREHRYTAAESEAFKAWERDLGFYSSEFVNIVNQVETGTIVTTSAANAAIGPGKDRLKSMLDGTAKDGAERQKAAIENARALTENRKLTSVMFTITTALAILAGLFSLVMLRVTIVRPLEEMAEVARRVSKGEIGVLFPRQKTPEFALLSESLERLRAVVEQARPRRSATSA
jgi:HAMP domain-containing protein